MVTERHTTMEQGVSYVIVSSVLDTNTHTHKLHMFLNYECLISRFKNIQRLIYISHSTQYCVEIAMVYNHVIVLHYLQ